jgi:hypothetical protein
LFLDMISAGRQQRPSSACAGYRPLDAGHQLALTSFKDIPRRRDDKLILCRSYPDTFTARFGCRSLRLDSAAK